VAVRLALDTNRYADVCRGNVSVVETVELADGFDLARSALGKGTAASCGR
jgi:hypothetical protein